MPSFFIASRPGHVAFRSLMLLLAVGSLATTATAATPTAPTKTDLFEAGKDGYSLYRIPGIVVTKAGTVLAYCEARRNTGGDWGPIDVMLRRSTDGGKTWLPRQRIVHVEGELPINPVAVAKNLDQPGDNTVNNPVAIVNHETGAVHFLYCLEYMRCFSMRSDDDGATWTEPVEITKTFDDFRRDYDWNVLATGPAHGIQLTHGPHRGRLVVPVWLSLGTEGHAHQPSVTATIYSDDHGRTWHRGEIAVPNTPEWVNPNETGIVQLADGRVMLNSRSDSPRHRRLVTISPNGATGWSQPRFDESLVEPICMAGIVRVRQPAGDSPGLIAFSNPDNLGRRDGRDKPGLSRDRVNVTVRLSDDEGKTWSACHTLEPGFSGYSDLAALPDGSILCFYERGSTDGTNPYRTDRLTVARFDEAWVRAGHHAEPPVRGKSHPRPFSTRATPKNTEGFRGCRSPHPAAADSFHSQPTPPHVIVILADDLGYSDLGCYGGEIRTPHIDRLAEGGIRFRDFHNVARCSPTRMALLTGLHPQQVMTDPAGSTPPARAEGNVFLSEILSANGYRTCLSGKWHLGAAEAQTPWARGFQHVFAPVKLGTGTIDYWEARAWKIFRPVSAASQPPNAADFYATEAIGQHATDFLRSHLPTAGSKPIFLYVAFNAPHFYLAARRAVVESTPEGGRSYPTMYADGWNVIREKRFHRMQELGVITPRCTLPPMSDVHAGDLRQPARRVPNWQTLPADRRADLARRMAVYAAAVEQLDTAVGKIVDEVEMAGQLQNTIVLFFSDNGGCAEGGVFGWSRGGNEGPPVADNTPLAAADLSTMGGPGRADLLSLGGGWADVCNTPYRFYKQQVHEGGIRTPLIIHWPAGHIEAGSWSDQNGHVVDILPTVIDATGMHYPARHRDQNIPAPAGISLLPACRGEPPIPRSLGYEHLGNRAFVEGDWKIVTKVFPSAGRSKPPNVIELYNLAEDPSETNDLADQEPERVRAMVAAWTSWAAEVGVAANRRIPEPPPSYHKQATP